MLMKQSFLPHLAPGINPCLGFQLSPQVQVGLQSTKPKRKSNVSQLIADTNQERISLIKQHKRSIGGSPFLITSRDQQFSPMNQTKKNFSKGSKTGNFDTLEIGIKQVMPRYPHKWKLLNRLANAEESQTMGTKTIGPQTVKNQTTPLLLDQSKSRNATDRSDAEQHGVKRIEDKLRETQIHYVTVSGNKKVAKEATGEGTRIGKRKPSRQKYVDQMHTQMANRDLITNYEKMPNQSIITQKKWTYQGGQSFD